MSSEKNGRVYLATNQAKKDKEKVKQIEKEKKATVEKKADKKKS
jgi:hypothetical protein